MVTSELLRSHPFFSVFSDQHLKAIAMVAEEVKYEVGEAIYEIDKPAEKIYLLLSGCVEQFFIVLDSPNPAIRKEYYLSDINPDDIFGLSSMIEPFRHTTTARATLPSQVIEIQSASITTLCELDSKLGYEIMRQLAKTVMEKLESTRVQLAATRA